MLTVDPATTGNFLNSDSERGETYPSPGRNSPSQGETYLPREKTILLEEKPSSQGENYPSQGETTFSYEKLSFSRRKPSSQRETTFSGRNYLLRNGETTFAKEKLPSQIKANLLKEKLTFSGRSYLVKEKTIYPCRVENHPPCRGETTYLVEEKLSSQRRNYLLSLKLSSQGETTVSRRNYLSHGETYLLSSCFSR
jgi:hypothetical protein